MQKKATGIVFLFLMLWFVGPVNATSSWIIDTSMYASGVSGGTAPSIVWTGTEYGVAWWGDRGGNSEIYFARLDASGNKIGTDVRITNNSNVSRDPSLVWTGTEFGVSWADYRDGNYEIYFARMDPLGNKQGSEVRITNATGHSVYPSMAWIGIGYGLSWQDKRDGNYEIYFAQINSTGTKIGSDVRITNNTYSSLYPSLMWNGSEYGLSWIDGPSNVYFARLDKTGTQIGQEVQITDGTTLPRFTSLAWSGSEYGLSWVASMGFYFLDDDIYFTRISSSGVKLSPTIRITNNPDWKPGVSLKWNGHEYGLSWFSGTPPALACDPPTCYHYYTNFTRIDSSGTQIDSTLIMEISYSDNTSPSVAWNGVEYGMAWHSFLTRIGVDEDGDDLSHADEVNVYGTDPYNYDTDGDGLTDGDEVNVYLTDPSNPDTDNGGKPDGQEVAEGTDPLDASDDVEGSPAPNQNRIKPRINGFDGCNMTFNNNTRGFGANASKIIFLTVPLFMVWIKKRFNRLSRRKGGGNI